MMNIGFLATSTTAMSGEGVYNYGLVIVLMMTGLYLVLSKGNMIKSIIGLNLFQVSVIMFYVSMGRIEGGTAPILYPEDQGHHEEAQDDEHKDDHGQLSLEKDSLALVSTAGDGHGKTDTKDDHDKPAEIHAGKTSGKNSGKTPYSNPLPHVLMLTAIVVGVATTALALSLVVRINEYYDTIEEDEIEKKEALL